MGRYSRSSSRDHGRSRRRRSISGGRSDRRGGGHRRDHRDRGRDDYRRGGRRGGWRDRSRERGRYDDRHDDRSRRRRRYSRSRSRGRGGRRRFQPNQPLDRFRHPSMSPEKEKESENSHKMTLEPEEIAYVFGRMGSTKDKLGRVSGTHIELRGSGLLMEGTKEAIEKAKKYTRILLAQRHGVVDVDPEDHPNDLTLMQIPTACKGFVTGKNGNTLRQIERESATLMTFCRTEKNNEPLAIFGTRRGRLYSQLKIMSIVEGKHSGWFIKDEDKHPIVEISEEDNFDDDWGCSWMKLDADMVGYALGRGGETRIKLEVAAGCVIQYVGLWAVFGGKKGDQARGKTYLTWLLEQQNDNVVAPNQGRDDLTVLWVPEASVGYVTGVKAKTLRNLESKTGTFCFFDKSNMGRSKEEMLIFSWKKEHREAAAEEVHLIVDFHQRKTGGNQKVTTHYRSGSRSGSGSMSRSRSRSRSRSNSRSRSRSGSRKSDRKSE